ncbi:hypothetical protein HAX54_017861 [Datura stramonium]|uniref:Uncharacterized protein n=1 Tax=Datura stramonium TaxID=4076 RepID=A0ABS8UNF4_DATST|nr:hypothetical protein [Datura stramonium]
MSHWDIGTLGIVPCQGCVLELLPSSGPACCLHAMLDVLRVQHCATPQVSYKGQMHAMGSKLMAVHDTSVPCWPHNAMHSVPRPIGTIPCPNRPGQCHDQYPSALGSKDMEKRKELRPENYSIDKATNGLSI